jgi:hypothetical protein
MMPVRARRHLALFVATALSAAALPGAQAQAQTSPLITVDQIPRNVSSPAKRRAEPASAPAVGPQVGQVSPSTASRAAPPQLGSRSTDTRVAGVPAQMVDVCEKAQATHAAPPKGVDCKSVLEARAEPPPSRRATPEEVLLGVAPAGTAVASTQQQRANLPDANSVARRLGSGDVQGAPIAEAVGAIAQQQQQQQQGQGGPK